MTNNRKFIADAEAFESKGNRFMAEVFIRSFSDLLSMAQTPVAQGGDMPVDLGFLRNSLSIEINGGSGVSGGDSYTLALAGYELGDAVQASWGNEDVGYAVARHYMVGVGQGGGLWRDKAAQKWSSFVAKNARKVR